MEYYLLFLFISLALLGSVVSQDDPIPLSYSVREDQGPGTMLGNVYNDAQLFTVFNNSVKSQLQWAVLHDNTGWWQYFTVSNQGLFRTDKEIDRELLCPSAVTCMAHMDLQILPYQYFRIIKVVVEIIDVNDNPPRFAQTSIKLSLSESANLGSALGIPAAEDLDSPRFGVQKYQLLPRTGTFDISYTLDDDEEEIYIILREQLDREAKAVYSLQLVATDGGTPPNSAVATVEIEVLDINDNSPSFDRPTYEITVTENIAVGSAVITLQAEDLDQGSKVKYSFSSRTESGFGDVFTIDEDSGSIITKAEIDYEERESYTLNVIARDESLLSLSAQASVIINVRDLNDNAPNIALNIFKGNATHVLIEEGTDAGMSVAHLMVTDPDSENNGKFNCFLSNNKFLLSQLSDNNFKIVSTTVLDREEGSRYEVLIRCDDRGNPVQSSDKTLIIVVTDVNDNPPDFSQDLYRASMLLNSPAGTHVLNVQATDKDEGLGGTLSYSILHPMDQVFRINVSSGDVVLKTTADFGNKKWVNLTVAAADHGIPVRSAIAHVVIDLVATVDTIPDFAQVLYSFSVAENVPIRTEVGTVSLLSSQHGLDIKYLFRVASQPPENVFTVDQYSGKLFTAAVPDREARESYDLVISAGVGGESKQSITQVTIFVEDQNDNPPVFVFPVIGQDVVEVSSQIPEGHHIATIEATDLDKAKNKLLTYMILSGNADGHFAINRDTGLLTLRRKFANNEDNIFVIGLLIQDEGRPSLSTEGELKVKVSRSLSPATGEQNSGGLDSNTYMIIGIVCGVVLILIIVIVIVVVCQRKNAKKYKDIEDKMKKIEDSNNNADMASTSGNMSRDSDAESRPSRSSFAAYDDPKFRFPQINPPPDSDSGCSTDIPNTESSRGSAGGSNGNLQGPYRGPGGHYGPGSLWQTQIPEDEMYQDNHHLGGSQEDSSGFGGSRQPRGRGRYGVNYNPDPHRGYSSGEEMGRYMNRPPSSMSYDGGHPSSHMGQDYNRPYHSDGSRASTPQDLGHSRVYGQGKRRHSTARRNLMNQRPALEKRESWSSDSSAVSQQPQLVTNNYRLHKSQGDMLGNPPPPHPSEETGRMVRSADWTPHRPTPRYPGENSNPGFSRDPGDPGAQYQTQNVDFHNRHDNRGSGESVDHNRPHNHNNSRGSSQNMDYNGPHNHNNSRRSSLNMDHNGPHNHNNSRSSLNMDHNGPQRNGYNDYAQPHHQPHHGGHANNQNGPYDDRQYQKQNFRNPSDPYNNYGEHANGDHSQSNFNRNAGGARPIRGNRGGSGGSVPANRNSALRGYLNLATDDVIQELEVTV